MNASTLRRNSAVNCVLCNVVLEWNGNGKVLENHVSRGPHRKKLRRESVHEKRARSIALKGVKIQTEYHKHIKAFFENYTGVESTFKYPINNAGKTIIIVRFFSPEDAQNFLNLKSSWIIHGQCAELIPDTFTGSLGRNLHSKGESPQKGITKRAYDSPQVTHQNVCAESDKNQQYSDTLYPQYGQSNNTIDDTQQAWSYIRSQTSNTNSTYPHVMTGSRNYESEATNAYSNNHSSILTQSHSHSTSDSKTPFVNEYRSVSFVDRNEPASSSYNPNPIAQSVYSKQPVLYGNSTSSHTNFLSDDRRQQNRDSQPALKYVDNSNSVGHAVENYKRVESGQNPQLQKGHRDRGENQIVKQDFKRRDRSRSPIQRAVKNCSVSVEKRDDLHHEKNKRILPKVRGSLLKGPFNKQVYQLLTEVNSDVCKFIKVKDVCRDICHVLNDVRHTSHREMKGATVKPFGCMNLGIGIKGAPLEVCIYLPDNLKLQVLQKKSLSAKCYEIIRDILNINGSLFRNVVLSNDQSTVTFTHISSKYEVRANILRDAMVLNDELFDIYIASDKRLVSIFLFLIFWAHTHGIIEESVFEEHEMILLIIFYLQRLTKPILPPAHMLQVDDGGKNMDNKCLSYWYTTFEVNSRTFPKNENDSDLLTLIEGFFLFYADFSFKNIVISPFSGLTMPSQVFNNIKELPAEFRRYIYLVSNKYVYPLNTCSPVCIQDPIKLNRNATITITPTKLAHFREKCLAASGLMYKFRMKQTEIGLTCALLNLTDNTKDHVHKITCEVSSRYPGPLNDEDTLLLSKRLTNLLDDVLGNILKAKSSSDTHLNYSKTRNLTDTSVIYFCVQYYNLWSSRKMFKNKVPHSSSTLEWEAALSDKIIQSLYKGSSGSSPMFEFRVKGRVKKNTKVMFIDISFKDVEEDFINGLITFITPIIDYELKRISIV